MKAIWITLAVVVILVVLALVGFYGWALHIVSITD
jgi:hypothetical protein